MTFSLKTPRSNLAAFSFIELVIVIAVIGIMSGLAISQFGNSANDGREIVARQQQGTIQTALSGWVTSQLDHDTMAGDVLTVYNAEATSAARLELFKDYLDDATYDHIVVHMGLASTNEVMTDATRKLDWHINLPDWAAGSYPKVDLVKSAAPAP
ncbi:MAG: type II secretory pathway pseudopilin PulG [Verrucomicrobiales bacterium]|jgi:type II secretory pathway pseudopilin PulG